jgi:hypothetical protein
VLAPANGNAAAAFDTDLDPAERSQRPFLQARVRYRWEMSQQAGEVGCGQHIGWIVINGTATTPKSLITSRAFACDLVAPFKIFELRTEAYSGQALAGLGSGQSTSPTNTPVRAVGGWAQLNVAPSPIWSFGGGFGMDDPRDEDISPTGRLRNAAGAVYVTTHPSGPLLLSAEIRRIATTYRGLKLSNDHVNLGFGFEF